MNQKNRSVLKLAILIAMVLIIGAMLTWIVYNYSGYGSKYDMKDVIQVKTYDMKIEVSNHVGFNIGEEELNFGTVIPSGGSTRTVSLQSAEPVRVVVLFEGDMAKWVTVSENDFMLDGNATLTFIAAVPPDTKFGNYTGKAVILIKDINK